MDKEGKADTLCLFNLILLQSNLFCDPDELASRELSQWQPKQKNLQILTEMEC